MKILMIVLTVGGLCLFGIVECQDRCPNWFNGGPCVPNHDSDDGE